VVKVPLTLEKLPDEESIAPGRGGCPGCPAVIGARIVTKILGKKTIMVNSTGCMTVNYGYQGAPLIPYIHSLFENAGAIISGIDVGLRALGKRDRVNLFAYSGDGGTVDIGLQALSGAVDRGHKFLYICYDNEGYMNTGVQRSGSTPYKARTTTTPVGKVVAGEPRPLSRRKDMVRIMAAHGIPYAATASVAYPIDYIAKIEKAIRIDGPTYIHLHAPCLVGWGVDENMGVAVARAAVETCIFPLYEVEDGRRFRITKRIQSRKPIEEYVKLQGRFRHLQKKDIETLQGEVDGYWEYLQHVSEVA
jgi:pyruvate ferredoxin oxidoreductase beta subunit